MSRAAGGGAPEPDGDPADHGPVGGASAGAEGRPGGDAGDNDGETVTVWRSADDRGRGHDTVTVFVEADHACRHLVEYDTEACRTLLEGLPEGATLPVEMERVAGRCDGWRVTGLP